MTNNDRFDLMIDAITELADEKRADSTRPTAGLPSLKSLLAETNSLPEEALYLGLAEDGLPVLLNLFDPAPGPLLVTGDAKSGKTTLLKMIARAVDLTHSPTEVQYCIITNHADEWERFDQSENCVGIYPIQHEATSNILESLVDWAHSNKGTPQSTVLLLVDDLDEVAKLGGLSEQHLRWLLLRGPKRQIWPIVTLNAGKAEPLADWLTFFRTRLFGQTVNSQDAQAVTGTSLFQINNLVAGSQFAMREGNKLLKFWVPLID
jgi:hypothetical protein